MWRQKAVDWTVPWVPKGNDQKEDRRDNPVAHAAILAEAQRGDKTRCKKIYLIETKQDVRQKDSGFLSIRISLGGTVFIQYEELTIARE